MNGQCSNWTDVNTEVPQGSILGLLLFLIRIIDLSKNLQSNPNLFAPGNHYLLVIENSNSTVKQPCIDLRQDKHQGIFQWKMRFNPDLSTQAKKMVFNHKDKNINHSPICFDNTLVNQASKQIYLGLILDK